MDQNPVVRRRRIMGPVILICIGVFFLVANLVPSFDPWAMMIRYWPVILIVVGLGKVWDYYYVRRDPAGASGTSEVSGIVIAVVLLMVLLGIGVWRTGRRAELRNENRGTQTVDLQGATAVTANLQFPAGQLNVRGGSDHLVDANFRYDDGDAVPHVDYSVDGGHGQLTLGTKGGTQFYFGTHDTQWDLEFNDAVPLDLTVDMGAGQSSLNFDGINLTHLQVHVGAGQVMLDLTGPRKQDLTVNVQGGVGQGRIRLPKDIGVRAHASGGIGAVNVSGLTKDGDAYVNAAYGKSPTTIDLTVQGGIGEIDLDQE
jgi:hypothetical protein